MSIDEICMKKEQKGSWEMQMCRYKSSSFFPEVNQYKNLIRLYGKLKMFGRILE